MKKYIVLFLSLLLISCSGRPDIVETLDMKNFAKCIEESSNRWIVVEYGKTEDDLDIYVVVYQRMNEGAGNIHLFAAQCWNANVNYFDGVQLSWIYIDRTYSLDNLSVTHYGFPYAFWRYSKNTMTQLLTISDKDEQTKFLISEIINGNSNQITFNQNPIIYRPINKNNLYHLDLAIQDFDNYVEELENK